MPKTAKAKTKTKTARTQNSGQAKNAEKLLVEALLQLAAKQTLSSISRNDLLTQAKIKPGQAPAWLKTTEDVLPYLPAYFDAKMLEGGKADGRNIRERLFDLMMRRFDALAPHRGALKNLLKPPAKPQNILRQWPQLLPALPKSLNLILEAAEAEEEDNTLPKQLRLLGLAAIYLFALRAFWQDKSPDLASTMASLDKALGRVDTLHSWAGTGLRAARRWQS